MRKAGATGLLAVTYQGDDSKKATILTNKTIQNKQKKMSTQRSNKRKTRSNKQASQEECPPWNDQPADLEADEESDELGSSDKENETNNNSIGNGKCTIEGKDEAPTSKSDDDEVGDCNDVELLKEKLKQVEQKLARKEIEYINLKESKNASSSSSTSMETKQLSKVQAKYLQTFVNTFGWLHVKLLLPDNLSFIRQPKLISNMWQFLQIDDPKEKQQLEKACFSFMSYRINQKRSNVKNTIYRKYLGTYKHESILLQKHCRLLI